MILLTREHAATPRDIFGHCYWENGAAGIKWVETSVAANCLRTNRTTKDYLAPKACNTDVEKTRHVEWGYFSKGRCGDATHVCRMNERNSQELGLMTRGRTPR